VCGGTKRQHVTETGEESNVRHLRDEHWSLRSILSIFEGGNTHMLDYVKRRPRWRPPKGKSNELYSRDILAFKQVYLSAAAATYRKNLAKKADAIFYGRITALRHEDAAREELLQAVDFSRRDPFQQIFEQNNMSGDNIPGFFQSDSPHANDSTAAIRGAGGAAVRNGGASSSKKGRTLTAPLMKHEAPNIELIKQRINLRRAMNPSINTNQHTPAIGADESGGAQKFSFRANMSPGNPTQSSNALASQRPRWRPSDHGAFIGEVGDTSIHGQYDGHVSVGPLSIQQELWSRTDLDEEQTMISSPHSKKAQIGMYRRQIIADRLVAQRFQNN
jgi:hypothetical protein